MLGRSVLGLRTRFNGPDGGDLGGRRKTFLTGSALAATGERALVTCAGDVRNGRYGATGAGRHIRTGAGDLLAYFDTFTGRSLLHMPGTFRLGWPRAENLLLLRGAVA
jgi:hypothetical protein